jgi:hypothetical protein
LPAQPGIGWCLNQIAALVARHFPGHRQYAHDGAQRRIHLARAGFGGQRVAGDTDQRRQFGKGDAEQFGHPPRREEGRTAFAKTRGMKCKSHGGHDLSSFHILNIFRSK